METFGHKYALPFAFLVAVLAMAGSLFFSEVMQFPPCVLCWYQRIAIYPLVAILPIGMLQGDKRVYRYAYPLAIFGWLVALYHNLIYYEIIPEATTCGGGISCTTKYIEWFGFVSIPLLSLLGFTAIIGALYLYQKGQTKAAEPVEEEGESSER